VHHLPRFHVSGNDAAEKWSTLVTVTGKKTLPSTQNEEENVLIKSQKINLDISRFLKGAK